MMYQNTPVRMATIQNTNNNKCWWGCGERRTLLWCWWECKLSISSTTAVSSLDVPQKLKLEIPFGPAIPLLGIHPKKAGDQFQKDTCTPTFIAALFTIAKKRNQPKCSSVDEWIKKMWYVYTMEYYSTVRRKQTLPFTTTWTELEGIMLSDIRLPEKDKYQMISLICGISNKARSEGTKQQQSHRTQERTNSYQRERDWGGWVGKEG